MINKKMPPIRRTVEEIRQSMKIFTPEPLNKVVDIFGVKIKK